MLRFQFPQIKTASAGMVVVLGVLAALPVHAAADRGIPKNDLQNYLRQNCPGGARGDYCRGYAAKCYARFRHYPNWQEALYNCSQYGLEWEAYRDSLLQKRKLPETEPQREQQLREREEQRKREQEQARQHQRAKQQQEQQRLQQQQEKERQDQQQRKNKQQPKK